MNTSQEAGRDPDSDEFDITPPRVAFEPLRFNLNHAASTPSNVPAKPSGGSSSYRAPYKKGYGLQRGGYLDENVPSKPGNVPGGISSKPRGGSGLQLGGCLGENVTISPDEQPQKKQKKKTEVPSFGKALASTLKRRQRPSSIGSNSIFNAFPPSTGSTEQPLETVSTSGKSSKSQPNLQQDELQTLV